MSTSASPRSRTSLSRLVVVIAVFGWTVGRAVVALSGGALTRRCKQRKDTETANRSEAPSTRTALTSATAITPIG